MERKDVMLNPPQDSQSRRENQAQHPHGGMVHIAQSLSVSINNKPANRNHQILTGYVTSTALVYCLEGHRCTELNACNDSFITCHTADLLEL